MLKIHNLHATVADKPILRGLSLTVNAGEVHVIAEPNRAGFLEHLIERRV